MAIPQEFQVGDYRDSFNVWFNSVVGELSGLNNRMHVLLEDLVWNNLTAQQKNALKNYIASKITAEKNRLDEIIAEINSISV